MPDFAPSFQITPNPRYRSYCHARSGPTGDPLNVCHGETCYEIVGDWLDEDGEPEEIYYCEEHYAEFVARVMEQFIVTGAVKPNN